MSGAARRSRAATSARAARGTPTRAASTRRCTGAQEQPRRPRRPASTRCAGGRRRCRWPGCRSRSRTTSSPPTQPTTCASRILEGYRSPVRRHRRSSRLRDAGALIAGKTNLDEFAMGSSTEHSAFGRVLHPIDPDRVPGGSSGGSAALVAAGVVPAALGSETGGSVRQPASFCGIVGREADLRAGEPLRARRLRLVARLHLACSAARWTTRPGCSAVISGHDPRDATTVAAPPMPGAGSRRLDLTGLRDRPARGVLPGRPRSRRARRRSTATIDGAPARSAREVREVSLPHTPLRRADLLHRGAGGGGGQPGALRRRAVRPAAGRAGRRRAARSTAPPAGEGFGAEVRRRILVGTYVLSAGYYDAYYGKAQQVRGADRRRLHARSSRGGVDLLLTPTTPTPAFKVGEKTDDPVAMYLADIFVCAVSLAGLPAMSLPVGRSEGLPVGVPADRADVRGSRGCWRVAARARSGARRRRRRCADDLGNRHRPRGARPARARAPRCSAAASTAFGDRAQHQRLPGLPRPARARCRCRTPRRSGSATRARAGARLHGASRAASSPARTTSIPTCRRATRSPSSTSRSRPAAGARSSRRSAGAIACGDHPAAPRGGRRQVAARPVSRARPRWTSTAPASPLAEIVSEPDLRSPGARRAPTSRRSSRSWSTPGSATAAWRRAPSAWTPTSRSAGRADPKLGTKTEVKNMNSFANVERALDGGARAPDRAARVGRAGRAGDAAVQRRPPAQVRPMRSKEDSHDYRYFPDPDLPPLVLDAGVDRGAARGAAGTARRAARPVRVGVRPPGLRRAGADRRARGGRLLRGDGGGGRGAQGGGRLGPGRRDGRVQRDGRVRGRARAARGAHAALVRTARSAIRRRSRSSPSWRSRAERRQPRRSRRAARPGAGPATPARSRAGWTRCSPRIPAKSRATRAARPS